MEQKTRKKTPQRRCTGCGERFDKPVLIRVVRSPEGDITLDMTGKKPGRGAYLCKNPTCLKKARKAHRLEQNLACEIPADIYDMLEGELTGDE